MAKGKYERWLSPEGLILLEGWARDGLTDEQIAHNMGVNKATLYRWKKEYCDICDALKKGKEIVDYEVENALLKKAKGYTYIEIIKERIDDSGQKKRHKDGIELTEKQWETAKVYFDYKCCYCGKGGELTKDHINPLHNGGKMTMSNIVPCCKSCNSSKKDNEMLSWYQKQQFYNKDRIKKIYEYVTFALSVGPLLCNDDEELVVTKEVVKHMPPDTAAAIFWLKNRRPDKWRDKVENVNINENDKTININLNSTKGKTI